MKVYISVLLLYRLLQFKYQIHDDSLISLHYWEHRWDCGQVKAGEIFWSVIGKQQKN